MVDLGVSDVGAPRDHGRQRLRNDDDECDMHDQEEHDRRHAQEVDDARGIEAAEQEGQLLELSWLPDRQPRQDHDHARGHDTQIERLLYRVVGTETVRQLKPECSEGVAYNRRRPYGKEALAEVSGSDAIDEIDDAVDRQEPHGREVPLQCAGKSILVMEIDRAVDGAAQRRPDRKAEQEDRVGIVDAPAAHDHDDDGERIEPMGDPHREGVNDHL